MVSDAEFDGAYETTVAVRYADLDTVGVVNNAVYLTYVEEGRLDYLRDVAGIDVEDITFVLASLECDFRTPVTDRRAVDVAVRVPELGRSSFPIEYRLAADGETLATATTTLVFLDPETRRPTALPEAWRDAIADYEAL